MPLFQFDRISFRVFKISILTSIKQLDQHSLISLSLICFVTCVTHHNIVPWTYTTLFKTLFLLSCDVEHGEAVEFHRYTLEFTYFISTYSTTCRIFLCTCCHSICLLHNSTGRKIVETLELHRKSSCASPNI